jgi:hypothetical protein
MRISISLIIFFFVLRAASAQVSVTVDTTTHFQTIEGWGHGGGIFSSLNYGLSQYGIDQATTDSINFQYLDLIAHDLGLTGSRMWEVGPRIDGTGMDNGDCDSIDWTKFQPGGGAIIAKYAVFFKNLIAADGYHTSFYSSPTYPTFATAFKPWVLNHPGERAQQIWADALWWKNNYGIDINYDVIYNEPGSPITTQILVDDVKALGPRLISQGLATKTQYAEAVAPLTDWGFISPVLSDSELWKYVGRLSYHNYGTADPYRADIRDFAKSLGITTAQTEMGNPTIDDIFNDLILGGVSYWEVGFSGGETLVASAGDVSWTPSATYYRMRQVLHYVRPGDIRINATSSDTLLRVVSFEKSGAITTVLLDNDTAKKAVLNNLPPGKYGVSQSPSGATAFTEFGISTVGADGKLTVNIGGQGYATTVYPYSGANHPPTIESWGVSPGYIVSPTSTATISVKASDPELDKLTYQWIVISQPAGANATITNPTFVSTAVNGLTAAGMYVFKISVSDGVNISTRKAYLLVFSTNPPPNLWEGGFRFGAPYGLVFDNPPDTTHANIELPTSSAVLQIGITDLANSTFDGRGKWVLVSQPAGANAIVDTTIYIYISIRANVSNMTVPGDYVFKCTIKNNPGLPDLIENLICTVHQRSSGPVVNSITVNPPTVTLPQDSAKLSAQTSDPEGQLLRHWWYVKSIPNGAHPLFDHQGLPNSTVSNLTIPGLYTFTLRVFDDIHMTTKDVSVTVSPGTGKGILTFLPDSLDFGVIDTGKSSKLRALVRNTGNGPLSLNTITVTGPFTDSASRPAPLALQPGDSLPLFIVFSPRTVGNFNGLLTTTLSDNSTASISLKGAGRAVVSGGVANTPEETDILIWPNPVIDELTIRAKENSHVILSDVLGHIMMSREIRQGNSILSLRSLPAGVYSLIIESHGTIVRRNIVKE